MSKGGILDFDWFGLGAKGAVNQELASKMSGENLAGLQTYVVEVVAAIKAGEGVSEEDMANFQAILTFVRTGNRGSGRKHRGRHQWRYGAGGAGPAMRKPRLVTWKPPSMLRWGSSPRARVWSPLAKM